MRSKQSLELTFENPNLYFPDKEVCSGKGSKEMCPKGLELFQEGRWGSLVCLGWHKYCKHCLSNHLLSILETGDTQITARFSFWWLFPGLQNSSLLTVPLHCKDDSGISSSKEHTNLLRTTLIYLNSFPKALSLRWRHSREENKMGLTGVIIRSNLSKKYYFHGVLGAREVYLLKTWGDCNTKYRIILLRHLGLKD